MHRTVTGTGVLLMLTAMASADWAADNVTAGILPNAVAVNPVTHEIYVATYSSGNATVIDGETNSTATVTAHTCPYAAAVNPVTHEYRLFAEQELARARLRRPSLPLSNLSTQAHLTIPPASHRMA
ncbi:MAG: hypothetical protein JSU73_01385 [candidate division WOR-3 bacterium]|nr:MAG: hypothetical protein JSU73_01385 [candidate division WOR-3 bacterium]